MTIEQLRYQVEQKLGDAQISEAIDTILAFAQQHRLRGVRHNALLLRAQFFSLKQKYEIRGMLHHQEYQVEANRIASGVLSLAQEGIVKDQHRQQRLLWLIPLLVVLLGGAIFWVLNQEPLASPPLTNSEQLTKKPNLDSIPQPEGPSTPTANPDPPVEDPPKGPLKKSKEASQPKKIDILITIDDCWEDSEIEIDGEKVGTVLWQSKTIKMLKKSSGRYNVLLRKGAKISQQLYDPETDDKVSFLCK